MAKADNNRNSKGRARTGKAGDRDRKTSGKGPARSGSKPGEQRGKSAGAGRPSGGGKPGGKTRSGKPDGEGRPGRPAGEGRSSRPDGEGRSSRPARPGGENRSSRPGRPAGDRNTGKSSYGEKKYAQGRKPSHGRKSAGSKGAKDDSVRLNKFIAASGICSRREADQLISAGLIKINGEVISELGTKVKPGDEVRYNGEPLRNERKVYVLLNKPKDYVTTTDDPRERRTVMMLIENACTERVYPVGRLDRQTTGVLLFTNDGELAKKLTHPSQNKKKIYHIFLDKNFTSADMKRMGEGLELEDGFIQPDAISYASKDNKKEVGLEVHSGKNRIVRRMFEHMGYRVNKLDRVYFAGLTKKDLPRGKWRLLTDREISRLKMNSFE